MSNKLKSLTRRNLVLLGLTVALGAWVLLRPEPAFSHLRAKAVGDLLNGKRRAFG